MLTYLYNLKSIFLDQVNFFRKKSSSFNKKISYKLEGSDRTEKPF